MIPDFGFKIPADSRFRFSTKIASDFCNDSMKTSDVFETKARINLEFSFLAFESNARKGSILDNVMVELRCRDQ